MNVRYLVGSAMLCMVVPAGHAIAQTDNDEARPITLVGCIMRESEFRDMYGPGRSGPRGAGIGLRNEYMIGYRPQGPAFDGKWHRVQVKSDVPGANVYARNGYYGRR